MPFNSVTVLLVGARREGERKCLTQRSFSNAWNRRGLFCCPCSLARRELLWRQSTSLRERRLMALKPQSQKLRLFSFVEEQGCASQFWPYSNPQQVPKVSNLWSRKKMDVREFGKLESKLRDKIWLWRLFFFFSLWGGEEEWSIQNWDWQLRPNCLIKTKHFESSKRVLTECEFCSVLCRYFMGTWPSASQQRE